MRCASCQETVGDALRAVPGVAAANVDLMFHRATVSFDPAKTTAEKRAETPGGYDATPA